MKNQTNLVKYHKCEIFTIIENAQEKNTYFSLVLGNYKIKDFDTKQNAIKYIKNKSWDLLLAVISIINEFQNKKMEEKK